MRIRKAMLLAGLFLSLTWLSANWSMLGAGSTATISPSATPPVTQDLSKGTAVGQASSGVLPIAVDGAKAPELIPDKLAYYHFMIASAVPANSSADQLARRERVLNKAGLSKADRTAFELALGGLQDDLDRINASRSKLSPAAANLNAILKALKYEEAGALDAALSRVGTSLSSEGVALLDSHIQHYVKKHIVVYGEVLR